MTTKAIQGLDTRGSHDYGIRTVEVSAPLRWLRQGVDDFRRAPVSSLVYGLAFTAACLATATLAGGLPWLTLMLATGLVLTGPYLASGLYAGARQLESGEPVNPWAGLRLLGERKTAMALYSLFLALVVAGWVRLASLLFAIKFDLASPSVQGYLGMITGGGDPAVVLYALVVGLMLAGVIFVTSAVSIPMIIDRDVNPLTAIHTSARAVKRNWRPMALWAGIILALTLIGIGTGLLAMVLIFPVLGYATWHSYRATVR